MSILRTATTRAQRYQSDGPDLYAAKLTGLRAFESPPLKISEFAEWLTTNDPVLRRNTNIRLRIGEIIEELNDIKVFLNISKIEIQKAEASIRKLQTGEELTEDEAYQLLNIVDFIKNAIGYDLESNPIDEISSTPALHDYIESNQLRTVKNAEWSESDILNDAMDKSYILLGQRRKFLDIHGQAYIDQHMALQPTKKAERVLAGLYLENFFIVAKSLAQPGWEQILSQISLKPNLPSHE
jgi:hypothetical protein